MSSIYVSEPATRGRAIIFTSCGPIEVELWPKEAPKAVRNWVQLAAQGYYDGLIWHRVVKGTFIQTGDPSGTGTGGESIYGQPFPDEFHPRLRFNVRGRLAMSNDSLPNANGSQFFLTLDAAPWLDKKHTIFGRVVGNSYFNAVRIGEVDTDKDDRPFEPPRVLRVEIVENPLPGIVDVDEIVKQRRTAAAALPATDGGRRARPAKSGPVGKHLLSFAGEDGSEEEDDGGRRPGASGISGDRSSAGGTRIVAAATELHDDDVGALQRASQNTGSARAADDSHRPSLPLTIERDDIGGDHDSRVFGAAQAAAARKRLRGDDGVPPLPASAVGSALRAAAAVEDDNSGAAAALAAASSDYSRLRDELRAARRAANVSSTNASQAAAAATMLTPLQEMRAKYKTRHKELGKRETETMNKLLAFKSKLHSVVAQAPSGSDASDAGATRVDASAEVYSGQVLEDDDGAGGDDDGGSWMTHKLRFKKHIDDRYRAGDDGLVTVDPLREPDTAAMRGERGGGGAGAAPGARGSHGGGSGSRAHGEPHSSALSSSGRSGVGGAR